MYANDIMLIRDPAFAINTPLVRTLYLAPLALFMHLDDQYIIINTSIIFIKPFSIRVPILLLSGYCPIPISIQYDISGDDMVKWT